MSSRQLELGFDCELPPEGVALVRRTFDWMVDRRLADWVGREVELEHSLAVAWRPGMTGRELVQAVRELQV